MELLARVQSPASPWWPPVAVATGALLFTIATFWWLNVRRGQVRALEPRYFAAVTTSEVLLLRLPLVFQNTGAAPIAVQDLRVKLNAAGASPRPLEWRTTRTRLAPTPDDVVDLGSPFVVNGRAADRHFVEFGVEPGTILEEATFLVSVEARLGHRRGWTSVLNFDLHASAIVHRENYIAYRNRPWAPQARRAACDQRSV